MTLAHYITYIGTRERESFSPNWKPGYWLLRFGVYKCVYESVQVYGERSKRMNERRPPKAAVCRRRRRIAAT